MRDRLRPHALGGLAGGPDEGFVLSRINGSMDIGTILKISPMPRIEAQIVLLRLRDAGHIELG